MLQQVKEVFSYKEMLISTVRKELRARYRGSVLGFLWTFINPIMQLLIYSIIFPYLLRMNSVENYPIFVFTGLLPWIFFTGSLTASTTCVVGNGNLVKKIYFPRMILPLSIATTNLVNYFFGLIIVIPALFIMKISLSPWILLMPLIMLIQYAFVIGFCMVLSALYVYFRDLEHIITIVTTVWFYLTPIVYPIETLSGANRYVQLAVNSNPMKQFVDAYRNVLMYSSAPDAKGFLYVTVLSVIVLLGGTAIFSKLQRSFAEEI